MRPVVVLAGLLLLNGLLLPPLLRWVGRSAAWLRDPERRGTVVVRWGLDQLAQTLLFWRYPDRDNELTELLCAVGVVVLLLALSAFTLLRELRPVLER